MLTNLLATAGFAEMPGPDLLFWFIDIAPHAMFLGIAIPWWLWANRRSFRNGQVSMLGLFILIAICAAELVLLKLTVFA